MIDRNHPPPIRRQAEQVNIAAARSMTRPNGFGNDDLKLMRRINECIKSSRSPVLTCCAICGVQKALQSVASTG